MNNSCSIRLASKDFRDKICRICLCEVALPNLVNIFAAKSFYLHHSLLTTFKVIAPPGIKIDKNDTLPINLCLKCAVRIRNFASFRKRIKESDRYLRLKLEPKGFNASSSEEGVICIDVADDGTKENVENLCKSSKQDNNPNLVSLNQQLLTVVEDDVIYIDGTQENIENFPNLVKKPRRRIPILKPISIDKLKHNTSTHNVNLPQANSLKTISKAYRSVPNKAVEDDNDVVFMSTDTQPNVQVEENKPISIERLKHNLRRHFLNLSQAGSCKSIVNDEDDNAVVFVTNDTQPNVKIKENDSLKEVTSNTNSSIDQNDRNVIKELLNSSISHSIIVTNESNSIDNQFRGSSISSTNISTSISKEKVSVQLSQNTNEEEPVKHNACSKCTRTFSSAVYLQRHLEYHELNVLELETAPRNNAPQPSDNHNQQPSSILMKTLQGSSNASQSIKCTPTPISNGMNCYHCDQIFPVAQLSWHIYLKHKNQNNLPPVDIQQPPQKGMQRCIHCQQVLPAAQLDWHILLKHKNENNKLPIIVGKRKCKYCVEELVFTQMRSHIKTNHMEEQRRSRLERFPCSACTKKFNARSRLQKHFKVNHELKFHCNHCNQGFVRNTALVLHLKAVHKIKIAAQSLCYICGKLVSSTFLSGHYQTHVKKSMKCTVEGCSAVLKYNWSLRDHKRRVHGTGDPSFICEHCGKGYAVKSSLKSHQVSHMSSHQFKYVCPVCKRRFYASKYLKSHLNVHYRKKVYTCPECSIVFAYEPFMQKHINKVHSQQLM